MSRGPSFDYATLARRSAQDVILSSRVLVTGLILGVLFDYILSPSAMLRIDSVPRCLGDAVEGRSNAAEAGRSRSRALDDKQNLVPSFDYAQDVASRGFVALPGLGGTIKRRGRVAPKSNKMIQVLMIQYGFRNNPPTGLLNNLLQVFFLAH